MTVSPTSGSERPRHHQRKLLFPEGAANTLADLVCPAYPAPQPNPYNGNTHGYIALEPWSPGQMSDPSQSSDLPNPPPPLRNLAGAVLPYLTQPSSRLHADDMILGTSSDVASC